MNVIRFSFLCTLLLLSGCEVLSSQPGTRSLGTVIDDEGLEITAMREIRKADPGLKDAHISAFSFHGVLLLTGQVATDELKDAAGAAVAGLRKITKLHNEIQVSGTSSYLARTNDSVVTGTVRAKLVANDKVNSDRIKIVTENGVVYLLGALPREEADVAVTVARNSHGVQRLVVLFDFVD